MSKKPNNIIKLAHVKRSFFVYITIWKSIIVLATVVAFLTNASFLCLLVHRFLKTQRVLKYACLLSFYQYPTESFFLLSALDVIRAQASEHLFCGIMTDSPIAPEIPESISRTYVFLSFSLSLFSFSFDWVDYWVDNIQLFRLQRVFRRHHSLPWRYLQSPQSHSLRRVWIFQESIDGRIQGKLL